MLNFKFSVFSTGYDFFPVHVPVLLYRILNCSRSLAPSGTAHKIDASLEQTLVSQREHRSEKPLTAGKLQSQIMYTQ